MFPSRSWARRLQSMGRGLAVARRGAAAVEFALSGLALITFFMVIINLGYLGFTVNTLQRVTTASARIAAAAAAADMSGNGNQGTCPSASQIQGYFNGAAVRTPLFAPTLTLNSPVWTDNGTAQTPNGTYLQLTATETWKPIGFGMLSGVTLSASAVAFVMGAPTC
jgi:Flp pilus assembly protein TadG